MKLLFARNLPRKKTAGERGQALLEIIPVIVLLVTLTFGVIDFSRAIWQVEVLSGLTREGSNLAARSETGPDSVTAVISDGSVLNLTNNGKVIITSVENQSGTLVITNQWQGGALPATSRLGTYDPNKTTNPQHFPVTTPLVPQPGDTVYVTEIYIPFSPITPLGMFVKNVLPSNLYDIAYF